MGRLTLWARSVELTFFQAAWFATLVLRTHRPATGVSRALAPKCLRECPRECPENRGVQGSVPRSVSAALQASGPRVSKKCPESVLGVLKRCPGHSGDTLGTLFGHSGPEGPRRHSVGHFLEHPGFHGHSRGHSRRHFRLATQRFCYRGPKPQKCPKCLGEGAKGLLGQGCQRPLALVQKRVAPVHHRVLVVQKTLGRHLLPGFLNLLHPLLTTLGTFEVSGPCSRTFGSQLQA